MVVRGGGEIDEREGNERGAEGGMEGCFLGILEGAVRCGFVCEEEKRMVR